jgi:chromate reductase
MTSTPSPIRILAIPGSLRADSLNRGLLVAARRLAGADIAVTIYDRLASVPLFDEDAEARGVPDGVAALVAAVRDADALLIATPEYNQSIPGVLKNALDWLPRAEAETLAEKPTAVIGATVGPWGTRLAQAAVRQTLFACGVLLVPGAPLNARFAKDLIGPDGALGDPALEASLRKVLSTLGLWAQRRPSDAAAA